MYIKCNYFIQNHLKIPNIDRQVYVCDQFKKCSVIISKNKPHANMQYIFKHIICHTLNCVFDFASYFIFWRRFVLQSSARLMHLIISERMKYD